MAYSLSHCSFDKFLLVHLSVLGTSKGANEVKISATNGAENSKTPVTVLLYALVTTRARMELFVGHSKYIQQNEIQ